MSAERRHVYTHQQVETAGCTFSLLTCSIPGSSKITLGTEKSSVSEQNRFSEIFVAKCWLAVEQRTHVVVLVPAW